MLVVRKADPTVGAWPPMSGFDCRRQAAADLDEVARQVLSSFALTRPSLGLLRQGNAGGFSGARLWRSRGMTGDLCLRAWPSEAITASGLQVIHDLMRSARDAGLAFVPLLLQTYTGATWVAEGGRLWDVATWMPGRADFHDHPSYTRLEAACTALARLHRIWALTGCSEGACPAVGRRLGSFAHWKRLLASGWRPGFSGSRPDRLTSQAERAWKLLDGPSIEFRRIIPVDRSASAFATVHV